MLVLMALKDPILLSTITTLSIPLTYAAYHQFWYIYGSVLGVLMSGLVFHSTKDPLILRIDQAFILQFGYMTWMEARELGLLYLVYYGFLYTGIAYFGGYYTRSMAFSPHYVESRIYHGMFHILIASLVSYGVYVKSLQ